MIGWSLALALAVSSRAAREGKANTETLQQAYDEAFQLYQEGDYRKAISKWNDIVRSDPQQSSAREMIEQARKAIAEQIRQKRAKAYGLIEAGRYRDALLQMQSWIDLDPADGAVRKLADRLEQVSEVVAETPAGGGNAWRAATTGLRGLLLVPQDLKLAHNGLRYAAELSPQDGVFARLLALLRGDYPELASQDDVVAGMKLLEYKHLVALHHIYDARYHAAIPVLNEILQLEPEDVVALKQLGSAYFSLGLRAQAREAWSKALRLAPKDSTLREFLAKVR